ncbi:MAG TPA: hypothetical protein EYG93_07235 [Sulfurospirillum arcachonense]|nr:hypothetical protein [Sulfurospirillum arcachonense]
MLDKEIIKYFKKFQQKTGKYKDLKIEDVRFEKIYFDNTKYIEINPKKSEIDKNIIQLNKPVSFVPLKSIDPSAGIMLSNEIRNINDVYKSYTYFRENDIIFTKVTPSMENGNIAIANNLVNRIGFGSSEYYIFRCKKINNKLLWYFLRADFFRKRAKKSMKGTGGLKRVPIDFFYTQYIPIPKDLNETYTSYKIQQAIVDFLEDAFAWIERVKKGTDAFNELIERLDRSIVPSVFNRYAAKKSFAKYAKEKGIEFDITDIEFEEKSIEDIADSISGSSKYTKNYYKNNKGKYPLYTGSQEVIAYVKPISEDDIVNVESVSFNKDNDAGTVAFYHDSPYIIGGHHYGLIIKDKYKDKILTKYFYFCMVDIFLKNRFYQSKQPVANIGLIKQFKVKIPKQFQNYSSLEIQKILADFIDYYKEKAKTYFEMVEKNYNNLERLRKAYLARTFSLIDWSKE